MKKYPKLKFISDDLEGEFDWGIARNALWENFYDIEESEDFDISKSELQRIIKEDPEFIDAYNSLGWQEIDIHNYGNAFFFFDSAYNIANKYIPKSFDGQIIWGVIDNRPFLRTLHGLGIIYLFIREWEKATLIFTKLLKYNPNDNQGIRSLAIHSHLAQGNVKEILKLCSIFPDDTMPDVLYGKVLANYRLGQIDKAKKALGNAINISPNVAKEIVKTKHKEISTEDYVTVGGEDEAYEYWKNVGQYWTDIKLKKIIKEFLNKER